MNVAESVQGNSSFSSVPKRFKSLSRNIDMTALLELGLLVSSLIIAGF